LVLAGLVFAGTSGVLVVGRWLSRRRAGAPEAPKEDADEARARDEVEADVPARKDDSGPRGATGEGASDAAGKRARAAAGAGANRVEGFICQLGDVVMRLTGEEAWLAGGVVLSEDVPIAILFVAPEAGHDTVIYVRARPKGTLLWLEPLDPSAILVGNEPPSSVEHRGIRFDRARRLPLRPRRIGVGAPNFGDAVVVAEYTSAGAERLLAFKATSGEVQCYRGVELEEGAFEVIGAGDTTL
jgi:hypothetical protein